MSILKCFIYTDIEKLRYVLSGTRATSYKHHLIKTNMKETASHVLQNTQTTTVVLFFFKGNLTLLSVCIEYAKCISFAFYMRCMKEKTKHLWN